ncbi:MAG: hypothetical protein R3B89_06515 [Polyangiaceae bacterium]
MTFHQVQAEEISAAQVVVSVASSVFAQLYERKRSRASGIRRRDSDSDWRNPASAATLCHVGRHEFDPAALKVVPEWPLVWWDAATLRDYQKAASLRPGGTCHIRCHYRQQRTRFVRTSAELPLLESQYRTRVNWAPFISSAKGRSWQEELREAIDWKRNGLAYRVFCDTSMANFRDPGAHFRRGVAFSMIGANFSVRAHRFLGVFVNRDFVNVSRRRCQCGLFNERSRPQHPPVPGPIGFG